MNNWSQIKYEKKKNKTKDSAIFVLIGFAAFNANRTCPYPSPPRATPSLFRSIVALPVWRQRTQVGIDYNLFIYESHVRQRDNDTQCDSLKAIQIWSKRKFRFLSVSSFVVDGGNWQAHVDVGTKYWIIEYTTVSCVCVCVCVWIHATTFWESTPNTHIRTWNRNSNVVRDDITSQFIAPHHIQFILSLFDVVLEPHCW